MMSDTPERLSWRDTSAMWKREIVYLMSEMFHALKQAELCTPVGGNPDLTKQERRDSWIERAIYLRGKVTLCAANAFNDHLPHMYVDNMRSGTDDADDTSHQTVRCERCGAVSKKGFFMPCVCKDPHPALVKKVVECPGCEAEVLHRCSINPGNIHDLNAEE